MKKIFVYILVFLLAASFSFSCSASTVFSVSSDKVYIGRNWDFDESRAQDVVFIMKDLPDGLVRFDIRLQNTNFLCTSVNNKGLFTTCNYNVGFNELKDNSYYLNAINTRDLHEDSVIWATTVDQISTRALKKGVYCPNYEDHIFIADKDGNACMVETDNERTNVINDEDNFLVGTNFPLYSLSNLGDLASVPCERYKTAYTYISNNIDSFDFDDAVETLKQTSLDNTIYSLIAVPAENKIYLFLNHDFQKIWEISFDEKCIKTAEGFDEYKEFKFGTSGISFLTLQNYQNPEVNISDNSSEGSYELSTTSDIESKSQSIILFWIIIFVLITSVTVAYFIYKSKRDSNTQSL